MDRRTPDQESVATIVDHFRSGDGHVLLEEPDFEDDLAVAVRVTLLVGLTLDAIGDEPASAHEMIDFVRGDIFAAIEFFQHVESIAWGISGISVTDWPWPDSLRWRDLTSLYRRDLTTLASSATKLPDRYAALVRLIRLQLALWALSFGVTANAYIA
jgi:hypothetical protein